MRLKILYIGALLFFLISLFPVIERTYEFTSDTYGLMLVATLKEDEITFNPYSKNGFLITSSMALWLIENTDYHYGRCSSISQIVAACGGSLVAYAGRLRSINQKVADRLLEYFIHRGEPINTVPPDGLPAIHQAILFRDQKYLKLLLDSGADPFIRARNKGKEWNNMNALEFVNLWHKKRPMDYAEIAKMLNDYVNKV